MGELNIVINGAGSAGISIAKLLSEMGFGDIILCDIDGLLYEGRANMNEAQQKMAAITNKRKLSGTLADAMKNADIFIGVSAPNVVTKDMVRSMADKAIVFPMANPTPEIMPEAAKEAGAFIVGTGRSDYPNQINNVLAFPGIFRGALDVRASDINEAMKVAAAKAIAALISDEELNEENIIPSALNKRVAQEIAAAVAQAAIDSKVARADKK